MSNDSSPAGTYSLLFALACCGSGCPDPNAGSTVCDLGETQSCACWGGREGVQSCASSRDAWDSCDCRGGTDGVAADADADADADSDADADDADSGSADTVDDTGVDDTGTYEGPCDGNWDGAWQGQVGPGCGLHPSFVPWLDALAYVWSTQPEFVCQAPVTQTTCLGQRFDGYWFDPGDEAILLLDATTTNLNAIAPGAVAVSLAHEWGHVNQLALGQIAGCLPASDPFIELELEADCYAGFASAILETEQLLLGSAEVLYATTCGAPSPTHGTCEQRWCAFASGYEGAIANAEDVCVDPIGLAAELCPAVVAGCF